MCPDHRVSSTTGVRMWKEGVRWEAGREWGGTRSGLRGTNFSTKPLLVSITLLSSFDMKWDCVLVRVTAACHSVEARRRHGELLCVTQACRRQVNGGLRACAGRVGASLWNACAVFCTNSISTFGRMREASPAGWNFRRILRSADFFHKVALYWMTSQRRLSYIEKSSFLEKCVHVNQLLQTVSYNAFNY